MKVTLKKIDIENFRGVAKSLHYFDKQKTTLSAPIGSGKTTLLEAYLFAMGYPIKDYKPKEYKNNRWLEIANTKTRVEVLLLIEEDGETRELTLVRKDKNFEVDEDKFTTLANYQNAILEQLNIDSFDLYCDLLLIGNFNSKELKVKRNILLNITGVNKLLVETQNSYELLKDDFINGLTTEEISKNIKRQIKENETKQIELRTKLDYITQNINKYDIDFNSLEQRKIELEIEISECQNDSFKLEQDLIEQRNKVQNEIYEKQIAYNNDVQKLNATIFANKQSLLIYQDKIAKLKEKISELTCREIDEVLICPTCGMNLPKNNDITNKLKYEKEKELADCEKELQELLKTIEKFEISNKSSLEAIRKLTEKSNNTSKKETLRYINEQIKNVSLKTNEYKEIKNKLEVELNEINEKLALKKVFEEQKNQLSLVKKEQIELLKRIQNETIKSNQLKDYLANIEKITTSHINKYFEKTNLQWQLYENAKTNDNLSTTFEMLWNNKRYSSRSRGERLCADLELLYVLQSSYDVYLPIIIDNVGDLGGKSNFELLSQQILLETSQQGISLEEDLKY